MLLSRFRRQIHFVIASMFSNSIIIFLFFFFIQIHIIIFYYYSYKIHMRFSLFARQIINEKNKSHIYSFLFIICFQNLKAI